jgi:dTDP-4-amino-4,6-dideoxygalactose transaminase
LENGRKAAAECLSLPMGPHLTLEQAAFVADLLKSTSL